MIPPLPIEQHGSTIGTRHLWVILCPAKEYLTEEVCKIFFDLFEREPDKCYSPDESKTKFWWLGWVTGQEAQIWIDGREIDAQ